jgi:hypothetical protein
MAGLRDSSKVIGAKLSALVGNKESVSTLNAVNMLGWTGREYEQGLAKAIWEDDLKVKYADMDEAYGAYKIGEDGITISKTLLGGGKEESAKLATVMSHEGTHAAGNRIEALAHIQGNSTYNTINAIFGLQADAEFSGQMISAILDPESWKENTGDVDYWIRTNNGGLKNDGLATLKDENGNVIKSLKDLGLTSETQIEGALLAILNIDKNDTEKVNAVRNMMTSAGMIHSYSENPDDWYWMGVREARLVDPENIATQRDFGEMADLLEVREYDLGVLNQGQTILFASIIDLVSTFNMDGSGLKKFVNNAYGSAIDFMNFADEGGNLSIATQLLSGYLDPEHLSMVQTNREWYNNALINGVNINGMVPGAVRDEVGFGMESGMLNLASSTVENAKFFEELHTGIDFSKGTEVLTPRGFWEFTGSSGHKATLQLYGGDLKMRIQHLDPTILAGIPRGKIYGTSEGTAKIFDFPKDSFGSGTGAHVHVEMTRNMPYKQSYTRQYVNPETLAPKPDRLEYWYRYYDADGEIMTDKSGNFGRNW